MMLHNTAITAINLFIGFVCFVYVLIMTGCNARQDLINIRELEIVSEGITSNGSIRIDLGLSNVNQAIAYDLQYSDQGRIDILIYQAKEVDKRVKLDDEMNFSIELDSVFDLYDEVDIWINRTYHLGGWSLKNKDSTECVDKIKRQVNSGN